MFFCCRLFVVLGLRLLFDIATSTEIIPGTNDAQSFGLKSFALKVSAQTLVKFVFWD